MNRVDFIDWLHTEIDAVLYGEQSKEQLLLKAIPMVDLMLQKCQQAQVSGSSLVDLINSVEFYDLMQSYRHAPIENQSLVMQKFGDVQKWIVENCG